MKSLKDIFTKITSRLNKYWIAVIVFLIITFVTGESSLKDRISYNREIHNLEKEVNLYKQLKEENLQRLEALRSNNESLEKLAREEYQMTKSDEDLFIIR